MWLGDEFHGPRCLASVIVLSVCFGVVDVAKARLMIARNWAISFCGGRGMFGQIRVDFACHRPENLFPGILDPVSSARSAMVITRRYNRT
jgi:hypothetical protein